MHTTSSYIMYQSSLRAQYESYPYYALASKSYYSSTRSTTGVVLASTSLVGVFLLYTTSRTSQYMTRVAISQQYVCTMYIYIQLWESTTRVWIVVQLYVHTTVRNYFNSSYELVECILQYESISTKFKEVFSDARRPPLVGKVLLASYDIMHNIYIHN